MPYICVHTPTKMTEQQKSDLKSQIGKNVSMIDGKVEARLMVKIEDGCNMYFGGEIQEQSAFVEIRLFRVADFEQKKNFVESIFKSLKEILSIENTDVFVNITESLEWGSNGTLNKA